MGASLQVRGVKWEETGLVFTGRLNMDQASSLASTLEQVGWVYQFAWGDLLNHAEAWFGEQYTQLAPAGSEGQTIAKWKWVAGKFALERRHRLLTYSHHEEVAKLESKEEQDEWLDKCEREGWSVRELRAALKENKGDGGRTVKPTFGKEITCPSCGACFNQEGELLPKEEEKDGEEGS